jgi:flagellar biosynthesis protein FlhG
MAAPAETHYGVLGIGPRATPEQVERAYRHAAGLYDEDALATYSLLDMEERQQARERGEAAYMVLRDASRRHEYDVSLGIVSASSDPTFNPAAPPPAVPRPERAPVVVLPDPVTGPDLKRFRESRGISLRDIASASKVGIRYLEYIEAERREVLPAPVYLRGFVQEYARAVGLDPRPTAESYVARVASIR